jgi:hypothetical protein
MVWLAAALAAAPLSAQAPAPFRPVEIKTRELKIVGGAFIPTPSFRPVEITSKELRVVGGALLPTPKPFAPITIETSPLRISGPAPAPRK